MELSELIEKVKQKDNDAFAQLYNMTYRRAYIEAMSFMKNDDKAREILQLAYVKIYQNIDKVNDEKNLYKWINTVIANTCKDELRKRHEFSFSDYENSDDDNLAIDMEDESRDYKPDENIKYEDDRAIVLGFINELPTEQRAALVMQVYDEMKISEIAEIFETSESTIKSRLKYAKQTIKQKVEEYKKEGNTLFVLPLVVYLKGIFDSYETTINVNKELYASISNEIALSHIPSLEDEGIKESTKTITKEATKSVGKVAAGNSVKYIVVAAVAIGGATGGYMVYNSTSNNAVTIDLLTEETISYEISGANGSGTIEATLNEEAIDYNSNNDISSFLADITFSYDQQASLSNGDVVTITANYDENKADELGLKIEHDTYSVTITDLLSVYTSIDQIPDNIISELRTYSDNYLKEGFVQSDEDTTITYDYVSMWLAVKDDSTNYVVIVYKETKDIHFYVGGTNYIYYDGVTIANIDSSFTAESYEVDFTQGHTVGGLILHKYVDDQYTRISDASEISAALQLEYPDYVWSQF
ncbi:MAG: sigma-70 family RNA polymerase sigma factor [Erysipelotrichaceae bacterium]|nr:sigma-70 family RNA polymerase sigma factor [Erysipelotrichaceae bacterium]